VFLVGENRQSHMSFGNTGAHEKYDKVVATAPALLQFVDYAIRAADNAGEHIQRIPLRARMLASSDADRIKQPTEADACGDAIDRYQRLLSATNDAATRALLAQLIAETQTRLSQLQAAKE
jgi:hypothetical protein